MKLEEAGLLNPALAGPEGIVGLGGPLRPERLIAAYRHGIFPWPVPGLPIPWVSPEQRAVLFFSQLHLPRSLRRAQRKSPFAYTFNQNFSAVIQACAKTPRRGESGTWITSEMQQAYTELHYQGWAHSVEVWDGKHLVGGIYGVDPGGVFSAESMFYQVPDASKLAFLYLVNQLQAKGHTWIDIQMMSPHMQRMGAVEISREKFLNLLLQSLRLYDSFSPSS